MKRILLISLAVLGSILAIIEVLYNVWASIICLICVIVCLYMYMKDIEGEK